MKVKVIEIFRDKYTNEVYKINDEIEITEERFREINQDYKYVEKIIENKKVNNKKADKKFAFFFGGKNARYYKTYKL